MKKSYFNKEYFKSKIFKKLFASYIMIILSLFLLYTAVIVFETININKERQSQYYNLKVQELANVLDLQFVEADIIVSNINSSDVIRQFSRDVNNNANINTYDVISEIKNYTISSYNLNIYDTVLFLNGFNKAYSSIQTYNLDKTNDDYDQYKASKISTMTLDNLFSLSNTSTVFNKEWIIYTGGFNSVLNQGRVCVLFDKNSISNSVKNIIGNDTNIRFCFNDEQMFSSGQVKNQVIFEKKSFVNNDIIYKIVVDSGNLKVSGNLYMIVAISLAIILCIGFIIISLYLSNKYYQPFGNIERIIDNQRQSDQNSNELENIISGIENLIGERNGYMEKMVMIKPYVQQGMIHGMLNGNLEPEKLDVLFKKEYMVLQKPYFLLSVINIAYVGNDVYDKQQCKRINAIISDISKEYSTEDINIALYDNDLFNTFVIINSNINENLDKLYYELFERIVKRIDNDDYVITVGVDEIREDISQLSEACNNAIKTLGSMVVGGRGSVYFYEKETKADKQKYYFPKDALNRITKALKERNLDDIKKFLLEILDSNTKKYDISPNTIQLLIDEVHITTIKALKNVDSFNMIDFSIEKIKTVATLDEVLNYYYAIYETISKKLTDIATPKKDIGVLDKSIITCIDTQYTDCEMSLQYLTEKFGVSNKYISIVCKKYFEMTYLQYLQEKRIDYAISLMISTQYSLEQIAKMSGYTNLLTFRRNFKSVKGINPSEFIEKRVCEKL
ncbi:helix-turn-helix domain-containing protein [[Clostridium] fimetarium]|uniref:AraC-type DNA-binding protein n=1 Tax=[Clostridium] fimetarium TaxID=99656 RepID=A0A1I0QT06_9FIRM|nr:helix-turn-helix domain-containing protein [[Clostridium] fimetarium]SEW30516.1 AraC-type DNA-binding protein [[Clostridium] fimetarium]